MNDISFSTLNNYQTKIDAIIDILKTQNQGEKISNAQIKKWKGKILAANKEVKAKEKITLPIDFVNHNMINPQFDSWFNSCDLKLNTSLPRIIEENDKFIVINKPANIHGHALSYSEKDNILSFLRNHHPQSQNLLENVNAKKHERGLLYRLDYETSGVLIYVKSQELYTYLRENYSNVVVEKKYLAIVNGHFLREKDEAYIHYAHYTHYLRPSGKSGHKMVVDTAASPSNDSFKASLEVKLLDYNNKENLSLLKIKLHTGVRHQIRVQLAALGYPIFGDALYGTSLSSSPSPSPSPLSRLFLHAISYKILLKDKEYFYKSETSDAFAFNQYFDFSI
ncbi:MAG: RluA family pseudouridine synthase [Oligoflexia bacterium]|nr:RluA family pseudouridine synthase [Oligoflexia bacterium]